MSEYVDRDALRRKLEEAIERSADADSSWGRGWRTGVRYAIRHLNDMPPLAVPRGWSRDELLAAMDAGSTVEHRSDLGGWRTLPRGFIWAWPDDVVAYDVRVVAPPAPKTEDVPLHEVVGRKLPGHDSEILNYRGDAAGVFVCTSTRLVRVSLKADGTVIVQAEGEA